MALYFNNGTEQQSRAAHLINVTRCENKDRVTISECSNSGRVLCYFGNIDKKHANSVLVAHGHIHGHGDRQGGLQLHMRSGVTNYNINDNYSGGTGWSYPNCCFQHSNDNNSKQINFDGMLSGYTTTGNSNFVITQRSANDSGARPFTLINPNASDDGKFESSMTGSVAIVYEILMQ
tara:strand:- start:718 stop:1248 length:531 start_codon:yes stop_codon:yes gene_type:complete